MEQGVDSPHSTTAGLLALELLVVLELVLLEPVEPELGRLELILPMSELEMLGFELLELAVLVELLEVELELLALLELLEPFRLCCSSRYCW